MTTFHIIEPEAAGDFADGTILDYATDPPYKVLKLQYELTVWLGNDLLNACPDCVVTERLRTALENLNGTGYSFHDMEVVTAEGFEEISPNRELPRFYWMKVSGIPGVDDVGFVPKRGIVVSDRFLDVLHGFNIDHCTVRRKPYRKE